MTTDQAILQHDKTELSFVAELKAKSAPELRSFMFGPWTASILSSEAIETFISRLGKPLAPSALNNHGHALATPNT